MFLIEDISYQAASTEQRLFCFFLVVVVVVDVVVLFVLFVLFVCLLYIIYGFGGCGGGVFGARRDGMKRPHMRLATLRKNACCPKMVPTVTRISV